MINALLQACAVPLDLGEAGHGSGQWCPTCRRWQVNTLTMVLPPPPALPPAAADDADMNLPDVITSNTPPSTPAHNAHFYLADEPWDALLPLKEQGGASGKAEDTCLTWTQVGQELRQMADTFYLRPRVDPEERHQQDTEGAAAAALTTATTIAEACCVSLLCWAAWKVLTRLKGAIQNKHNPHDNPELRCKTGQYRVPSTHYVTAHIQKLIFLLGCDAWTMQRGE